MKNLILIVLALGSLMMSACAKSTDTKEQTHVFTDNVSLNCSNIESNLVDGLPTTLGQTPTTPSAVQSGIIYYRQLASQGDQNSAFYTKNADLMEQRLNEFNVRFITECK